MTIAALNVPTVPLTKRQAEVLAMRVLGRRHADIARDLDMELKTVSVHLVNARNKYRYSSVRELVAAVRASGHVT